jgi:hypothetical protein
VLDLVHGGGTCDLPTESRPLRITVANASASFTAYYGYRSSLRFGAPLNVVVGGTTVGGGRYVTYRFTGGDVHEATPAECSAAAQTLPKRPPPPETAAEVTEDDWSAWKNGTLQYRPDTGR